MRKVAKSKEVTEKVVAAAEEPAEAHVDKEAGLAAKRKARMEANKAAAKKSRENKKFAEQSVREENEKMRKYIAKLENLLRGAGVEVEGLKDEDKDEEAIE